MAKAVSKNDPNKRKGASAVKKKNYNGRDVVPVLYICQEKGNNQKFMGAAYLPKMEPVEDTSGNPLRWDLL